MILSNPETQETTMRYDRATLDMIVAVIRDRTRSDRYLRMTDDGEYYTTPDLTFINDRDGQHTPPYVAIPAAEIDLSDDDAYDWAVNLISQLEQAIADAEETDSLAADQIVQIIAREIEANAASRDHGIRYGAIGDDLRAAIGERDANGIQDEGEALSSEDSETLSLFDGAISERTIGSGKLLAFIWHDKEIARICEGTTEGEIGAATLHFLLPEEDEADAE